MTVGIVWIKDDFRLENNSALIHASKNHDTVSAIYIFNKEFFDNKREAQKWGISKSLVSFGKNLNIYNICVKSISSTSTTIDVFRQCNCSSRWSLVI